MLTALCVVAIVLGFALEVDAGIYIANPEVIEERVGQVFPNLNCKVLAGLEIVGGLVFMFVGFTHFF